MAGTRVDDADQPKPDAPGNEREADVATELRRLLHLYRFGVLTDAEYLREKAKLLGSG
jgi:hypothetical protein